MYPAYYLSGTFNDLYSLNYKKESLFKNRLIQIIASGFLLLIFIFSVTPKIFLHNCVANHKDSAPKSAGSHQQQLGNTSFNCNCDNIVSESPFTSQYYHFELTAFQSFPVKPQIKSAPFYSSPYFFFPLRGPPSMS